MTIKEVSELTGVSADTLRYYERIGLVPPVPRNGAGIRVYGEHEVNWINFIKVYRSAGVSIESLIEYVRLFLEGDATLAARREILIEERQKLLERMEQMQTALDKLNYKIDVFYGERMRACEGKLRDENKQK